VDDEAAPTIWWGEASDVVEETDEPSSPPVGEGRREARHYVAGARLSRLGSGDFIAAAASGVVAISLFLPWFHKVGAVLRPGSSPLSHAQRKVLSVDSLDIGLWHWAIFVISILVIGYVACRSYPGRRARLPLPHWQLLAVATTVNAGLVLLSVCLPPDSGHWSVAFGADLALVVSLIAFGGALLRSGDPEVITPGGAWRAARAVRPARPGRTTREARNDRADRPARRGRTIREGRSVPADREAYEASTDHGMYSPQVGSPHEYSTAGLAFEPDDDLGCRFCGTANTPSARVCRGCGVVMAAQLDRR
jgi:hypothetical protein